MVSELQQYPRHQGSALIRAPHLVEIVETDAPLAHHYRLLTPMSGVGLVLACTLMATLGTMSRKPVAASLGVAPYAFDSGKFKGRRCPSTCRMPLGPSQADPMLIPEDGSALGFDIV
jgi:Transposase IS116/IS110/IS902 family